MKLINRLKKNKVLIALVLLSLVGLAIRVLYYWKFSTAFTYDQARDLLDLRAMFLEQKLRLIGANTSLHGVFYGPFWYWVGFPFYLLTGGHPATMLLPLWLFSFLMPVAFYLLIENKKVGLILALIFIFSQTFFAKSVVALNTNPMIFLTPLLLLLLTKYLHKSQQKYLSLSFLLIAVSFHYEPVVGVVGLPLLVLCIFFFRKWKEAYKHKLSGLFFLLPFVPQLFFELRHDFLQTRTILTLLTGGGSSLTSASMSLSARFFDRLEIFKSVWTGQSANNQVLALLFVLLTLVTFVWLFRKSKKMTEETSLLWVSLLSLVLVFIWFVLYPYALWPWYLESIDAIITVIIGLSFYFAIVRNMTKFPIIPYFLLALFLLLNLSKYAPWPLEQILSEDTANLRTRLKVVETIYQDSNGKGINIHTFAPYVYDYPYQYLIWWNAKTKAGYLPEEYNYLSNQPDYVAAKVAADQKITSRKAECNYLIIEPFESQEKWYWDWRYRFPEAKDSWQIGKTKVEKLCL